MANKKDQIETQKSKSIIEEDEHHAQNDLRKRTVLMRVKGSADIAGLIARIRSTGADIVSDGKSVIIVSADSNAINLLLQDEDVVSIDESKKLEMLNRSMDFK